METCRRTGGEGISGGSRPSMRSICSYGCPADKVYALHDRRGRIRRFSFSKSLLDYLRRQYLPEGSIQRHTLILGRRIKPSDSTDAKIFAICDRRKGTILRIHTCRIYAEELVDDSRYLAEAWLRGRRIDEGNRI